MIFVKRHRGGENFAFGAQTIPDRLMERVDVGEHERGMLSTLDPEHARFGRVSRPRICSIARCGIGSTSEVVPLLPPRSLGGRRQFTTFRSLKLLVESSFVFVEAIVVEIEA